MLQFFKVIIPEGTIFTDAVTKELKNRANILHHLESCHEASKCLVHSRSPHLKNVIGVAQMDRVWLCSSKTAEENEENIIKLNVSPNRQNIK